jgi:SNF2 family DNA or RNA helicase
MIRINTSEGVTYLRFPYDAEFVRRAKRVVPYKWSRERKAWCYPAAVETIIQLAAQFDLTAAQLDEETARLLERYDRSRITSKQIDVRGFPYLEKPYEHQLEALEASLTSPFLALVMDTGTGKTKVAIETVRLLHSLGRLKSCLIVCPRPIITKTWVPEFTKHAGFEPIVPRGTIQERARLLHSLDFDHCGKTPLCVVINYEAMRLMEPLLRTLPFDMMVLDESTRIKNPSAKQTKAAFRLGRLIPVRRILTGLPATQSPLDLYGQMKFLSPGILGFNTFAAFRHRYAVRDGYDIIGYQNLDELRDKLRTYCFRKKKEECLDLPPQVYQSRAIELSTEQQAAYEEMARNLIVFFEEGHAKAEVIVTKLLRLSQITGGFLPILGTEDYHAFSPNPKLHELLEMLPEFGNEQIIIWCRFRPEVDAIDANLRKRGYTTSKLYGGLSDTGLDRAIGDFQSGAAQIMVGTPSTGKFGLNLQNCHNVIYYSNSYSVEDRVQSEDRVHRIGQMVSCVYVDLVAEGTIDESVLRSVTSGLDLAKQISDVDSVRKIMSGGV